MAWEQQDPDLIVTIFTDDATYHERVLEAPSAEPRCLVEPVLQVTPALLSRGGLLAPLSVQHGRRRAQILVNGEEFVG